MKKLALFLLLVSNYTYSQVDLRTLNPSQQSVIKKPQHDPPIVVNIYTEVLAYNICTNQITVANDSGYFIGDTVLLIQMKGAVIDTSNTAAFGTILDYKNAGNYEFNYISQKTGNVLTFKNKLTRSYDIPDGVVQLVRVPKYKAGYFNGGLTCNEWDGTKGGVLAIFSTISLISEENIDVSGKGFKGGTGYNAVYSSSTCNQNNYFYPGSSQFAAFKGESIGSLSQNYSKGKGSFAGGGGGGNSHNAGGGGGGNGGAGGFGGYQTDSCGTAPFDNRGIGGKNLLYNSNADKIFLGSGGGAGHIDNANSLIPHGGSGGGIVIIITDDLFVPDKGILSNGFDARFCYSTDCNDGIAGGGSGGTVLLMFSQIIDSVTIDTRGGNGENVLGGIVPGGRPGPGGGGGGGVFYLNKNSFPANVKYIADGGNNGVIVQDANNAWGATKGNTGISFFDLVFPVDTVLFVPNIDSVRIDDTLNYCNNVLFKGLGYTNTYPVISWQWYFGDGGTASTQNAIHNYGAVGNYNVKLIVTDVNGCKDSISTIVNTAGPMPANAGADTTVCATGLTSIALNGTGTGSYLWLPAAVLNNNTTQNPIATIDTTTIFYLTISNGTGCSGKDTVTITVNKNPIVKTLADTSICKNATLILSTIGAVSYNWSPGIYVSDSTIASPQYADSVSRILIVTGTGANGCKAADTINVNVKTPVTFIAPQDKTTCTGKSVQLNGNNGNGFQYLWAPPFYLSNVNIKNPVANPPFSMAYTVTITDNTCNSDSSFVVNVTVLPLPLVKATKSNDVNCNKPFAQLNGTGADYYTWSPGATLNNAGIANPIANPVVTTKYIVTGTDNTGCENTDSITVIAGFGNNGILLPNSFSPNNDGINDCFGIRYYRDVKDLTFIIYNRYGIKVFETSNAAQCWDGNYKGQKADPGNYVYYISAGTLCGPVAKKGNIMLIR